MSQENLTFKEEYAKGAVASPPSFLPDAVPIQLTSKGEPVPPQGLPTIPATDSCIGATNVVKQVETPPVVAPVVQAPPMVPAAPHAAIFDLGQGVQNVQALIHRNLVVPVQRAIQGFPFSMEAAQNAFFQKYGK